jgi:hypothetical protein
MYAAPDFHQRQDDEFRVSDAIFPLGVSLNGTRKQALVHCGKAENESPKSVAALAACDASGSQAARAATDQRTQVVDSY